MSRVGKPYDNAARESFDSTLKTEWLAQHPLSSPAETQAECFACLEGFYNLRRHHSAAGYQSPVDLAVPAHPKLSAKPIQAQVMEAALDTGRRL